MSESRRAALRIASNYVRLIGAVIMGLLMIRFLLRAVGGDAVGLVLLLGSTMGLATMIEESVENSMVRELGRAHHAGDATAFRRMFNAAMLVSAGAALCSLAMYAVIIAVAPLLDIHDDLISAARWFLVAKSIESAAVIVYSPIYNMYMVTERMVAVNAWMLARRSSGFVGAAVVLGVGAASPSAGLIMFAWVSALVHLIVLALAVGMMVWRDRRLWPSPRLADRAACVEIIRTSGTNATIYATQLLQIPACSVLMNLAFGLHGNLVFGMAVQAAGYVRTIATGFVAGIEAVTTRLSSVEHPDGAKARLQMLVHHATRLQGFVAVPAAAGMFVIAPSFLQVWVAGEGVSSAALHEASVLARILVFGLFAQCVLDVWWRMLYGAGMVRHFAKPFAVTAIATAPLAWLLLQMLPSGVSYCGPALAYAFLNVALATIVMPGVVARCFGVAKRRLIAVITSPFAPAMIAAIAATFVDDRIRPPTLLSLALAIMAFGIVYAALAYFLTLEGGDRDRVAQIYRRISPAGRGQ